MPFLHGFDVSHYQGDFPWEWSRAQGHDLAACKATEGTRYVDPTLTRNRAAMKAAGFRYRGMYVWIKPNRPIDDQVAHFINTVAALDQGEFIQIDCEEAGLTTDMMWRAWQVLNDHYHGRVVIYAGFFFAGWTSDQRFRGLPWWLPWYGPGSFGALLGILAARGQGFPWAPIIWQWGGGANGVRPPGYTSGVDSNEILNTEALDRIAGYTDNPVPVPPTPPTQEFTMAHYFIDDRPAPDWQIWKMADDAFGNTYCCPVNDLPDMGKWDVVEPLYGPPIPKPLTALVALMDRQARPQDPRQLPPNGASVPVAEHHHEMPGQTGDVAR